MRFSDGDIGPPKGRTIFRGKYFKYPTCIQYDHSHRRQRALSRIFECSTQSKLCFDERELSHFFIPR